MKNMFQNAKLRAIFRKKSANEQFSRSSESLFNRRNLFSSTFLLVLEEWYLRSIACSILILACYSSLQIVLLIRYILTCATPNTMFHLRCHASKWFVVFGIESWFSSNTLHPSGRKSGADLWICPFRPCHLTRPRP